MLRKINLRKNLREISAITTKNIKLQMRFRFGFILNFIRPLVSIFVPFIIFGKIFELSESFYFGYYTAENYFLFLFLAYCINYLFALLRTYKESFQNEKMWQTLKGLIIAPCNRFNLVFGLMLSEFIIVIPPVSFFLTLSYILFPIPLINLFFVGLIFLGIMVIFASIGTLIGVLEIVSEDISQLSTQGIHFLAWLSCVIYPIKIFPKILQSVILLNPLYYIFDLLRLVWWMGVDYNDAILYVSFLHFFWFLVGVILLPIIAIYSFNKIYNRFGIHGY